MSEKNRVIVAAEGTGKIMEAASYEVSQFTTEDGDATFVRVTLQLGILNLTIDFDREEGKEFLTEFGKALGNID